jgi:hypothetical protein
VPISEMSYPPKKSWKLRCRIARNVTGRRKRGHFPLLGPEEFCPGVREEDTWWFYDAVSQCLDANCSFSTIHFL